jgi:hypothetical protein
VTLILAGCLRATISRYSPLNVLCLLVEFHLPDKSCQLNRSTQHYLTI